MALILNLETSTKTCSVVLSRDGAQLAIQEHYSERYSHSEKLNGFIEEVLQDAGASFSELDAVAVSAGPGSYTGLRIGVSTAKGVCYALNKPLIAISTHEALQQYFQMRYPDARGVMVGMIDARRMEVYGMVHRDKELVRSVEADVVQPGHYDSFAQEGEEIWCFGDGAQKCTEVLSSAHYHLVDDVYPSALGMIALSEKAFEALRFEDIAYFEPFYLKDFVAVKAKSPLEKLGLK